MRAGWLATVLREMPVRMTMHFPVKMLDRAPAEDRSFVRMGSSVAGEVMVERAGFKPMVNGAGGEFWRIRRTQVVPREGHLASVV